MPVVFDTAAFEKEFTALRAELHDESRQEWVETGNEAVRWMRGNGYREHSGELSRSMISNPSERGYCDFASEISAQASYALWVNNPTRPHVIEAKRGRVDVNIRKGKDGKLVAKTKTRSDGARMLRWYVNGRPVFARRVRHPGTKGAYFLERMWTHFEDVYPSNMQQAMDRVIGRYG